MTTSILLRSSPSSSLSPSPASTPLPALQPDHSSSSSSNSGSCLDLHRTSSAPSTRRIRFAPLPDLHRELSASSATSYEQPQPEVKSATQPLPTEVDHHDSFVALSPTVSPDSTLSSARSTPTIRVSPNAPSRSFQKSNSRILRPLAFLHRSHSSLPNSSPLFHSASLPASRDPSPSSLAPSIRTVPNSPSSWLSKLPRFATEDILTGTKSLFRTRSGSTTSSRHARPSSPPPQSLYRTSSTGSGPGMKLCSRQRDSVQGSTQSHDSSSTSGSSTRKRRASSSALSPGAGGGRHGSSVRMVTNSPRPSTAPSSPTISPMKHVKMLNGRVYGGKRYAAQTLANPFANVREEPEFVEWGYGGMGSVHASAGIGNDMWKGLQRSERGGALLGSSSFGSPSAPAVTAGGGRGSGARSTVRRKMSGDVPACGMENVGAGGGIDEDDGSGMAWLKKRRAEKEAKARLEQESKSQERRKSGDSIDASMYASTASTSTSLTACTSAASSDLTTPLTSRSPSVTDLTLPAPPSSEPCDLCTAPSGAETDQESSIIPSSSAPSPHPASADEREHHVLTAVRIPSISTLPHKHGHSVTHERTPVSDSLLQFSKDSHIDVAEQAVPLSPTDTETTSGGSVGEDGEGEQDDVDDEDTEDQDIRRKTAVGAGVEKISRHVDVVPR